MKFAALTLALLLAVGSQAVPLQADAPSQLQHMRAAMDVYMTTWKTSLKNILNNLDDTEYRQLKDTLNQRLEDMHTQIKEWQKSVSPMTDNVYSTIYDVTSDLRTSIVNDIESLKVELKPDRDALMEVIKKHTDYYHAQMEDIIREFRPVHEAEMARLRTRMEPVLEKIKSNAEETKGALIPIISKIQTKLTERLESFKEILGPYVQEYREHLKEAYREAQNIKPEDLVALRAEIDPLVMEVGEKVKTIFQKIAGVFMAGN